MIMMLKVVHLIHSWIICRINRSVCVCVCVFIVMESPSAGPPYFGHPAQGRSMNIPRHRAAAKLIHVSP